MTPDEIISVFKRELDRTLGPKESQLWFVTYNKGWFTIRRYGSIGMKERKKSIMARINTLKGRPNYD